MANVTQTLACTGSARVDYLDQNKNEHGAASYDIMQTASRLPAMLLGFAELSSSYLYKKLVSAQLRVYYNTNYSNAYIVASPLTASFDPATVTEGNRPSVYPYGTTNGIAPKSGSTLLLPATFPANAPLIAYNVMKSRSFYLWASDGGAAGSPPDSATLFLYTEEAAAGNRPQLLITVDDAVTITSEVYGTAGTSGYINPNNAYTFKWDFQMDGTGFCAGTWTQSSATFYWSDDEGSTWNSVAASGSTQSVTLAAGTLPAGTIQWKVTATDNQGTTSTSSVYTISTEDQLIVPTPLLPSGTVEDGSEQILFKWSINSPSGTEPTGSRIFYKLLEDANWNYININGPDTSYSMPANTLTGGTYAWGLFVKNQAGNYSSPSSTLQFVCVAAPAAPIVSCDGAPFATIDWQSDGQQAYRITVDETVYGPFFGTVKTFTLEDYLVDGPHEASVEIQGTYGLWSQAGTVSFTVQNVPGDAVALTGVFGRDAELDWTTNSATADFLIYRDGVQIGQTTGLGFYDRVVLGQHNWQVLNRLAGGNYTLSNVVSGTLTSDVPAIATLYGGDWLDLKLSENSDNTQSFIWSKTTSLRHMAGAVYPVLETSPFEDGSGSYDVSFPDEAGAKSFERYKGKIVILKNRGEVMVGCLSSIQKLVKNFYYSYSFTISRIHWEDYIDDA